MKYWTISKHYLIKFSKSFFDLSFQNKCDLILTLPEAVLCHDYNQDTFVLALLQHSSKDMKKQYPVRTANCKKGEKKISKAAKEADACERSQNAHT